MGKISNSFKIRYARIIHKISHHKVFIYIWRRQQFRTCSSPFVFLLSFTLLSRPYYAIFLNAIMMKDNLRLNPIASTPKAPSKRNTIHHILPLYFNPPCRIVFLVRVLFLLHLFLALFGRDCIRDVNCYRALSHWIGRNCVHGTIRSFALQSQSQSTLVLRS